VSFPSNPVVKRIEPLKCPSCQSDRVSQGFTRKKLVKKVGLVFLPDGWIYCDACGKKTNLSTGKSEWISKEFYEKMAQSDQEELRRIRGKRK